MKNIIKKISAFSMALTMLGTGATVANTIAPQSDNSIVASAASGTMKWSISNGTLTITGTDKIPDYAEGKAPWFSKRNQITSIIIPANLTTIGSNAFNGLTELKTVYSINNAGSKTLSIPNVTRIGASAFENCSSLLAANQRGQLTLGSNNSNKTLRVENNAFKNCDYVKSVECYYNSIEVLPYAFFSMDRLEKFSAPKSEMSIGNSAFRYDIKLTTVDFKPSCQPIHTNAFANTPYLAKNFTSKDYDGRNLGSAAELTRKQLIVNFFIDRNPKIEGASSDLWNVSTTNNKYSSTNNNHVISATSIENSSYKKNVSSKKMEDRLGNVYDAMDKLQNEGKKYGITFSYEMHPETNFYLAYKRSAFYENSSQQFGENEEDAVFKAIKEAGSGLDKKIDLTVSPGKTLSDYSEYLKKKYNVNGVVYLIHFDTLSTASTYVRSFTSKLKKKHIKSSPKTMDDFSAIFSKYTPAATSRMIAHEILHQFGAIDYYEGLSTEAADYADSYLGSDIFKDRYSDTVIVSPVTAYSIGWINQIDTPTYNKFFKPLEYNG